MARDLLDSDGSDSDNGGAQIQPSELKVNESFARRFEHNKKREELAKLEAKIGKSSRKRKRDDETGDQDVSSSDESSSEIEDEGDLATEGLDAEIIATIAAIRSKDPRVYDESVKFYTEEDGEGPSIPKQKKEKPMHLKDYHRENLLKGSPAGEDTDSIPMTYNQEQEHLKKSILGEISAAAEATSSDEGDDEGEHDSFLVAKPKQTRIQTEVELDVENADKDPENFLSNFMASRAWANSAESRLHPFESDDEEEEKRADEFEAAYNLRFEDPQKSNEKLQSHARDMAAKYSVRRDATNQRQRKREAEKEKKDAEKQQRKEEKARLRKLKIEELQEKIRRIQRAAGFQTKDIQPDDWSHFVDDDWDDSRWEAEMQKRFGDEYYAQEDAESDDQAVGQKRKPRKPKFDDDLDIKDIVPDFQDDEGPDVFLSDEDLSSKKKSKKSKKLNNDKQDSKVQRKIIEQLVDDQLQMELHGSLPKANVSSFRYRETSPQSFGLNARDILFAEDKQLNEFAGLKKLAAFRDPEKKRKDLKKLGKKARLRQWRLETFGNAEGVPARELMAISEPDMEEGAGSDKGGVDIRTQGKRKRRRRQKKQKSETDPAV